MTELVQSQPQKINPTTPGKRTRRFCDAWVTHPVLVSLGGAARAVPRILVRIEECRTSDLRPDTPESPRHRHRLFRATGVLISYHRGRHKLSPCRSSRRTAASPDRQIGQGLSAPHLSHQMLRTRVRGPLTIPSSRTTSRQLFEIPRLLRDILLRPR